MDDHHQRTKLTDDPTVISFHGKNGRKIALGKVVKDKHGNIGLAHYHKGEIDGFIRLDELNTQAYKLQA